MKIRTGFVSNSSSSSFIIVNETSKILTLVDFVKENAHLVDEWNRNYACNIEDAISIHDLIDSAMGRNIRFLPNEGGEYIFGDEEGDLIGRVFDYVLRDGGRSKSFSWNFHESLR